MTVLTLSCEVEAVSVCLQGGATVLMPRRQRKNHRASKLGFDLR
jgi:hypothetical protein